MYIIHDLFLLFVFLFFFGGGGHIYDIISGQGMLSPLSGWGLFQGGRGGAFAPPPRDWLAPPRN